MKLFIAPFNRYLISALEMYHTDFIPGFLCRRCARCCMGKLIPLYQRDIECLKTQIGSKFYERTTKLEESITGARYKMVLQDKKCIFLHAGLCTHYDLRPNTCRRHPFIVTKKNVLVAATCLGIDWGEVQDSEEYQKLSLEIAKNIDFFLKKTYFRQKKKINSAQDELF